MANHLFYLLLLFGTFDKFYQQYIKLDGIKTILITNDNNSYNYHNFIKELDSTPTIFLASLVFLLKYSFKEIYVIGITFQKENYYSEYKTIVEQAIKELN